MTATVTSRQRVGAGGDLLLVAGELDLLGPYAEDDGAGPDGAARGVEGEPAAVRLDGDDVAVGGLDGAGDEVGAAEEVGDEGGPRVLVEFGRGAHLLDAPGVHHRDGVGHGHGLLLVVGDVHEGEADLRLPSWPFSGASPPVTTVAVADDGPVMVGPPGGGFGDPDRAGDLRQGIPLLQVCESADSKIHRLSRNGCQGLRRFRQPHPRAAKEATERYPLSADS
jgi:hypothetical protein